MWPDEVDTPLEMPARVRFQKYRGLKSFRTSPWDPYENLPPEYARIFQFENLRRTQRRVLEEALLAPVPASRYVQIHIANVPASVLRAHSSPRIDIAFLFF
jgi:pre-rRNA-processing protein TSR1